MNISAVSAINPKLKVRTKGELAQAYRRAKKRQKRGSKDEGTGYYVDPVALKALEEYKRELERVAVLPRRSFWHRVMSFLFGTK